MIGFTLIFPEDLGGHISHGPSSLWALREFQLFEGTRDARRAAGYPCQIMGADYKRPIGVLSTCAPLRKRMSLGWPLLEKVQDKLVFQGEHTPVIGGSDSDSFLTSNAPGFGSKFWELCVYDDTLERRIDSLRDGDQSDLTPVGVSPLLSPSLASGSSTLRSTYEAWKAGTLSRAMSADISSSGSISAYFVAPPGLSAHSSSLSCLSSLWKISSAVATPGTSSIRSLHARSRSRRTSIRPLVHQRPRGHG